MFATKTYSAGLLTLGLILSSSSLFASSMIVIDESTEVDSIVNSIELPPPAEKRSQHTSSTSKDRAEQAREAGRELGREQSDSARQAAQESLDRQLQRESSKEPATREKIPEDTQSRRQTPRP